jgi:multidrug efflux pump
MKEITGPVVAIVLVLSAVFIPVAFMGGFTGQMYQQFAITIVISVTISGIVALTLTPALCAVFLKKETPKPFWFIRIFNKFFDFSTNVYSKGVGLVIKHGIISFLIVMGVAYVTYDLFKKVPTGLVPMEDKGSLMVITSLPPAAALERTEAVRNTMTKMALSVDKVERATAIAGFDIVTGTPKTSSGFSFINLEDWSERKNKNESTLAISNKLNAMFSQIPEATLFALNPPPIMGLSISGGFEMYVQDHSGGTLHELGAHVGKILEKANQRPELVRVRSSFDISTPQYHIEVDREKAKAQNVPITSIYSTLQSTFGAHYVNDFNLFGRTYKVNVQSEAKSRENPEDLRNIYVKSTTGDMIPLNTLIEYERVTGADTVDRFNGFQAAKIEGEPAPGYTSGDALRAIEEVANEVLPHGFTLGWVGSSYQEKEMEGTGAQAFVFGGIFIFLILAAQYERWLMPLAVITSVPFALLGAILAVHLRGLSNDIYFQIGLLVLMGLSAKNAILIVEFAMQAQERGKGIFEATIEAARLRFRPIVMTSLAFTIGVIPLVLSTGAGAASRHAIGTGVFGGMVAASTIAIFFVPLFYSWLAKLNTFFNRKKGDEHESA